MRQFKFLFLTLTLGFCSHANTEEAPNRGLRVNTYSVCGKKIKLEEARTPQERKVGLMFRANISKDQGMLFVFERSEKLNFWMRNVPFDIDIAYFSSKGEFLNSVLMKGSSPLMRPEALPTYPSDGDAQFAVETAPGFFAAHPKDKCKISPIPTLH